MDEQIKATINIAKSFHSEYEYLHGGCYAFAKALEYLFGGVIHVNCEECHCITKIGDKFYDITGVVKNTENYHPFRKKEEKVVANSYILKSRDYSEHLTEKIIKLAASA